MQVLVLNVKPMITIPKSSRSGLIQVNLHTNISDFSSYNIYSSHVHMHKFVYRLHLILELTTHPNYNIPCPDQETLSKLRPNLKHNEI